MSEAIADPVAPTDAPNTETDEASFTLHSRLEVAHILRDLVRTRALTTVHFGDCRETLLTALLASDSTTGEITFDCSGSEPLNRQLLEAGTLHFQSAQDKIKIRFSTPPARMVQTDGRNAFAVPFPQSMLRLQRREFYRALTPVTRAPRCVIPVANEGRNGYVETRLHDIGLGGIALISQPGEIAPDTGVVYANCRIVLPEVGNVVATLEICNKLDMTLLNGKSMLRVGCKFVNPSMAALSMVQRYIMVLERERRAKE
jgi:c-di-GMP-binding flagellar brake protein YcgR